MPYWTVAQLVQQRTNLALHFLTLAGYETYMPRLRVPGRSRKALVPPPLFPGYVFVSIELQWHTARWSPGVVRIVLDGMTPARVPDAIITEIRSRERKGLVDLPKPSGMQHGDRVRVLQGPFAGHLALYAGMKPRERIEVLLSLLGGQHRVTLPKRDVEAV